MIALSEAVGTAKACAQAESKGGKSELRRTVRRVTPGQGDLKDSGTENIPLTDAREGEGE